MSYSNLNDEWRSSLGISKFHNYLNWTWNYGFHPTWIAKVVPMVAKGRSYGWENAVLRVDKESTYVSQR